MVTITCVSLAHPVPPLGRSPKQILTLSGELMFCAKCGPGSCGWKLLPRKWKASQEPALPRKEEFNPNMEFSFAAGKVYNCGPRACTTGYGQALEIKSAMQWGRGSPGAWSCECLKRRGRGGYGRAPSFERQTISMTRDDRFFTHPVSSEIGCL